MLPAAVDDCRSEGSSGTLWVWILDGRGSGVGDYAEGRARIPGALPRSPSQAAIRRTAIVRDAASKACIPPLHSPFGMSLTPCGCLMLPGGAHAAGMSIQAFRTRASRRRGCAFLHVAHAAQAPRHQASPRSADSVRSRLYASDTIQSLTVSWNSASFM